jgi:putative chitinase
MHREPIDWDRLLSSLGVKPLIATKWSLVFADEIGDSEKVFSRGEEDLLDFLPQTLVECQMLTRLEENLQYSPERIRAVWPSRFATVADAIPYSFAPQKLANCVYGGRMGNVSLGDGWKYRGRGLIMVTGLDGYRLVSKLCGQDFDVLPELMEQPHYAMQAAIAWWEDRIPDTMLSDQVRLRKRVNGGSLGLEHVAGLRARLAEVLA